MCQMSPHRAVRKSLDCFKKNQKKHKNGLRNNGGNRVLIFEHRSLIRSTFSLFTNHPSFISLPDLISDNKDRLTTPTVRCRRTSLRSTPHPLPRSAASDLRSREKTQDRIEQKEAKKHEKEERQVDIFGGFNLLFLIDILGCLLSVN